MYDHVKLIIGLNWQMATIELPSTHVLFKCFYYIPFADNHAILHRN
jgi:hypothetical protein